MEASDWQAMLAKDSFFSLGNGRPCALFVCGCEGAGKTTFLERFCSCAPLHDLPLVDVDRLAVRGDGNFLSCGRKAVTQVNTLLANRKSFVRESTLTSFYDFGVVHRAKQHGYMTGLVFVGVRSAEIARKRVQIEPAIVHRHFERGIANLPLAIELFDRVCLVDNTSPDFKLFARFENRDLKLYTFCPAWFRGIQKEKGYRFTGVYD